MNQSCNKIVVTGSRFWPKSMAHIIDGYLCYITEVCTDFDVPVDLYHGACPYGADTDSPYKGVDGHADAYGRLRGWRVHPFPPKPSQGRVQPRDFAIRNQKLVDTNPDVVIAFFLNGYPNKGTQMTVNMARRKNLTIIEIRKDLQ